MQFADFPRCFPFNHVGSCKSPMISTQKINMALAAQTIYLEKLQKVLKDDLPETESKIKGDGNVDTILEKQLKRLQGEVNFISKC